MVKPQVDFKTISTINEIASLCKKSKLQELRGYFIEPNTYIFWDAFDASHTTFKKLAPEEKSCSLFAFYKDSILRILPINISDLYDMKEMPVVFQKILLLKGEIGTKCKEDYIKTFLRFDVGLKEKILFLNLCKKFDLMDLVKNAVSN